MAVAVPVEVFPVPPHLAAMAWRDIAPLVAPAVDRSGGRHNLQTTLQRLQSGHMQALLCLREAKPLAACVVQVARYPAQNWLQILFCGGSGMRLWLEPLLDEIDSLAYENECVGIEISGRGGWRRVLRKYGYHPDPNHPALLIKPLGIQEWKRAAS
jgi:hypothetical protein